LQNPSRFLKQRSKEKGGRAKKLPARKTAAACPACPLYTSPVTTAPIAPKGSRPAGLHWRTGFLAFSTFLFQKAAGLSLKMT